MARRITYGWDANSINESLLDTILVGTPTIESTITRNSGPGSIKFAPGAQKYIGYAPGDVDLVTYSYRLPFYFDGTPSTMILLVNGRVSAGDKWQLHLDTNRKVFINGGVGQSDALTANTWYNLQIQTTRNGTATVIDVYINGVLVSTISGTSLRGDRIIWGNTNGASSGVNVYFDDVAINDSTGSSQTGLPSLTSTVKLLKAVGDNAIGANWVLGAGGAPGGNAFGSVDNLPPVGVASGSATNGSQIRNTTNNTGSPGDADFNLQTPEAAGVPVGATIYTFEPIVWLGAASNTAQSMGTTSISPAGAEVSNTSVNTVGTFPTNWHACRAGVFYTVDSNDTTTVRVSKNSATATGLHCCFVGAYIEWEVVPSARFMGVV